MNFDLSSLWRREDKCVAPLTFRLPAMGDVSGFRKSDTPDGRCGKPIPRVGQLRQVYLYRSIFLLKSNVDIVLYWNREVDLMDTAPIKRLHLMSITMRHFVYIKYIWSIKQDFYYIILILEYVSNKKKKERMLIRVRDF